MQLLCYLLNTPDVIRMLQNYDIVISYTKEDEDSRTHSLLVMFTLAIT